MGEPLSPQAQLSVKRPALSSKGVDRSGAGRDPHVEVSSEYAHPVQLVVEQREALPKTRCANNMPHRLSPTTFAACYQVRAPAVGTQGRRATRWRLQVFDLSVGITYSAGCVCLVPTKEQRAIPTGYRVRFTKRTTALERPKSVCAHRHFADAQVLSPKASSVGPNMSAMCPGSGVARHAWIPMPWNGRMLWQTHPPPPDKIGFVYMLNGDTGASNTDPWATKFEHGNHWIKTSAHVMIVGSAAKTMAGYPRTADADPTKPYVMWPGTPYEHLMLPVK
jgi:hypothetical protein